MGVTKIEWTATVLHDGTTLPGYTFNPVVGCTKISPACNNCYAEGWAKRTGHPELWSGERRRTSEANWLKPLRWNREARLSGTRHKVFCASLSDVFDNQWEPQWRADMWHLIGQCPDLDWLLLTKRPQNIHKMLPRSWSSVGWPNVWLGTTVENQDEMAKRRGYLLSVPAAVHFLSCEPLLERVYLPSPDSYWHSLDWVICGGESGGKARMMDETWARSLRDECDEMGIAFFMKQMSRKKPIPSDLLVRQFPR